MNNTLTPSLQTLCAAFVLGVATLTSPGNVLVNPGFESGTGTTASGWTQFGNAFRETTNTTGASITARSGEYSMKQFGTFSGASGAFQSFSTTPGMIWDLQGYGLNWSPDAMQADNFGLLKVVFKDSGNNEIAGFESAFITSVTPQDAWQFLQATGTAPANTVTVELFALFIQPGFNGGAAWFDDLSATVIPEPSIYALMLAGLAGVGWMMRKRD